MVIFTFQHMCQILQQITEGDLEACIFFLLLKYIYIFPQTCTCVFIYYGSTFVWTDFRVSMPLRRFLSC